MVKRMKSLATFGAGPYATGDAEGRFGQYNIEDVPKLLGIFLAVFDNAVGPKIRVQVPENLIKNEDFAKNTRIIIPKMQLFQKIVRIHCPVQQYNVLGFPVALEHNDYERGRFTFNVCFVIDAQSSADTIYEPLVQKCVMYLVELEQECFFLSDMKNNHDVIRLLQEMFDGLVRKGESIIEIMADEQRMSLYFKLCPSYRGIEPPEISVYMVPMFIREVTLTNMLVEKMDVLSQKIIPQIDGIRTVKEIANYLEIDASLVARCVRNLHFYECVSLVPMFLYSNTYVATERVHDFYKNKSEINECLEFVKIQSGVKAEDGTEIPLPLPEFSDVFRLFLSLKCGLKLSDWMEEERPRSMGIDEHRLVQFGMHHQFLRKLTVYPICTVPTHDNKFLSACNGKTSLEELSFEHSLDPDTMYHLLDESKKFEFVMK